MTQRKHHGMRPRIRGGRSLAAVGVVAVLASVLAMVDIGTASGQDLDVEAVLAYRSLDGSGNHLEEPGMGAAGSVYVRVAEPAYADGLGEPVAGPSAREISNRIFNDTHQNVFSERGMTQWVWAWGQFVDHNIGLVDGDGEEAALAFDSDDPLEEFDNDLGVIAFTRSAAAPGTGVDSPREQVNTVSSYLDGWAVYGGDAERLDWLRVGPLDGDPTNNSPMLLLSGDDGGYLPTAADRGDPDGAPEMVPMGALAGAPEDAAVAGDVRANENIGLTAVQTLFVREHNRIVALLPEDLPSEVSFEIARRIVVAEIQHITYTEFLPAVGVELPAYSGYDPNVDPTLTNEFATVGYRAHSMIHGEFEMEVAAARLSPDDRAALEAAGIELVDAAGGDAVELAIPLNLAFGNPELLRTVGLDAVLAGMASERQYANDEQIDNQLRSVLFQLPAPPADGADAGDGLDGTQLPERFTAVLDLGALDVARSLDHGIPSYNGLRVAFGLAPAESFTDITGETSADLGGLSIDDPAVLDIVGLFDESGAALEPFSDTAQTGATSDLRRTTLAARLAAVFGDVDDVDAFTGMVSEAHVVGTEFGELQLAMWTAQFGALRNGDRFYVENDPVLDMLRDEFGLDYRRTLAEVIADNTGLTTTELPANVFVLETTVAPADGNPAASPEPAPEPPVPAQSGPRPSADRPRDRDDRVAPPPRRRP
ncbi:MAG: peroxidase family protein [Acidimicrobiales bacterium]|nr:peroxidase family protein [Acidimicrobiales bacterium]